MNTSIDTNGIKMNLTSLMDTFEALRRHLESGSNYYQVAFNTESGEFSIFEHVDAYSYVSLSGNLVSVLYWDECLTPQELANVTAYSVRTANMPAYEIC